MTSISGSSPSNQSTAWVLGFVGASLATTGIVLMILKTQPLVSSALLASGGGVIAADLLYLYLKSRSHPKEKSKPEEAIEPPTEDIDSIKRNIRRLSTAGLEGGSMPAVPGIQVSAISLKSLSKSTPASPERDKHSMPVIPGGQVSTIFKPPPHTPSPSPIVSTTTPSSAIRSFDIESSENIQSPQSVPSTSASSLDIIIPSTTSLVCEVVSSSVDVDAFLNGESPDSAALSSTCSSNTISSDTKSSTSTSTSTTSEISSAAEVTQHFNPHLVTKQEVLDALKEGDTTIYDKLKDRWNDQVKPKIERRREWTREQLAEALNIEVESVSLLLQHDFAEISPSILEDIKKKTAKFRSNPNDNALNKFINNRQGFVRSVNQPGITLDEGGRVSYDGLISCIKVTPKAFYEFVEKSHLFDLDYFFCPSSTTETRQSITTYTRDQIEIFNDLRFKPNVAEPIV